MSIPVPGTGVTIYSEFVKSHGGYVGHWPVVVDSHHFDGEQDPDPHLSEKFDPDPH
jgi:hypothetical protein